MRLFMTMFLLIGLTCIAGCQKQSSSVKVVRENGEVVRVDLENNGTTTQINSREQADQMIAHYEGLVVELKAARDQFKVKEPVQPQPQPK